MRQKTNLRLILMFLLVLFLIGNTFNIFASEEPVLMDEEKHNTENTVIEDITEEVAETVSSEDTKELSADVLETETARAKESRGTVRAIVQNGTIGTVDWTLDDAGVLTFGGGVFPDNYNWSLLGNIVRSNTKTVTFTAPVMAGNSLFNMFYRYTLLTNINGLEKLDTRNVTMMSWMFYGCSSLTSLDVSNFDTSSATDMANMFGSCSRLTSLDVSNFDTRNVTRMDAMFYDCSGLTSIDVSNFDTSKVTRMEAMFSFCSGLTSLDVRNFDTSKVTRMSDMFSNCDSLTTIDVSNFDTGKVTNMDMMFFNNPGLTSLDLRNFDTRNVTNMSYMFFRSGNLTSIDVRNFDTSNATNISYMFSECTNLTNLDVSGFDTSKVTDMGSMFAGCANLTNLDVSGFDTKEVTQMYIMFARCTNLTNLDVSNFDTSKVIGMYGMFTGCTNLTNLDVSNFDTSKVTNMYNMFSGCTNLTNLDVSNFDTSKVTDMGNLFSNCTSLTKLDISSFNTVSLRAMYGMFSEDPIKELSIGPDFRFKFNVHLLKAPSTNAEYTGNWELVGSGETFTHTEFLNYDGTKPGTYVWQRAAYNVTYDSKGGTAVTGESVINNSQVTEPTNPTKAGHVFDGWYKEEGLVNQWNFTMDLMPMNNITLYAKWNINSYNVTYDSKGGSPVAGETVEYNSAVTEPANPTKAGYIFEGWHKEEHYTNKWDFLSDVIQGNVTLYAKWKAAEYRIIYNLNGGTNSSDNPLTYEFGVGVVNFEEPAKDGYKFLGWFESDTSNVEITNIGATEIGDKTLHARWEKISAPVKPGTTGKVTKAGTVVKYNKAGTKTGDATNLIGLGIVFLASGGYVITRRKRRQNNG